MDHSETMYVVMSTNAESETVYTTSKQTGKDHN
uniref:Uncharacterized protein n=1 Tax=Rhizophora mucronata TaxID=61149 RepID=A0A2P2QIN3_RHIMU